jgi:hypothetical protein
MAQYPSRVFAVTLLASVASALAPGVARAQTSEPPASAAPTIEQQTPPPPPPPAQEEEAAPKEPTVIERMATGFRFSVAPGVFFQNNGNAGFSLELRARYGIKTGPIIIAPGADALGFFPANTAVLVGMPTFTVMVPLGPVAPYGFGGVGGGGFTAGGQGGVAVKGGGGLIVVPTEKFGLGVEVSHMGIIDSLPPFEVTTVAPFLFIGI